MYTLLLLHSLSVLEMLKNSRNNEYSLLLLNRGEIIRGFVMLVAHC